MAVILDMQERKRHLFAKKGFAPWSRRFGTSFSAQTSVRDLEDAVLRHLIKADDEAVSSLHDLIMGIRGLGPSGRFHELEKRSKMTVTDITIYLLDLLRFEAMHRLNWIEDLPVLKTPLFDLVSGRIDWSFEAGRLAPKLSPAHPKFDQYLRQFEGDRNVFVRKLIPDVILAFCNRDDDAGKS